LINQNKISVIHWYDSVGPATGRSLSPQEPAPVIYRGSVMRTCPKLD